MKTLKNCIGVGLLCGLCLVYAGLLHADESGSIAPGSTLMLMPKVGACPIDAFKIRMGQRVNIEATGTYAQRIRQALETTRPDATLRFYLDGTLIPHTPIDVLSDDGVRLVLFVDVVRNTYDPDSRRVWDTLFKHKHSYDMPFDASLKVGSYLPWAVNLAPAQPMIDRAKVEECRSDLTGDQQGARFLIYVGSQEKILGVACACLAIFFMAFFCLLKTLALRDGGSNSFYSLGRSQMAFWGLLIVLAFVGVWIIDGTLEDIPTQMLMLLGISGGTGLGAYIIGETKEVTRTNTLLPLQVEQAGLAAKQAAGTATPEELARLTQVITQINSIGAAPLPSTGSFFRDICHDGTGLSFHRMQVVIWSVVLGVVFVVSVIQAMSMPEFPGSLLILMGVSNLTYLGFKIPEKVQ